MLMRELRVWELVIMRTAVEAAVSLVYKYETDWKALTKRFVQNMVRHVLFTMLVFTLDRYVVRDKVQLYVMMALAYITKAMNK